MAAQIYAFDQPSKVTPIDGEVVVDGPDGVAVSLTPAAARETAERLIAAADAAEKQGPDDSRAGEELG